jgi:hypothetical protein
MTKTSAYLRIFILDQMEWSNKRSHDTIPLSEILSDTAELVKIEKLCVIYHFILYSELKNIKSLPSSVWSKYVEETSQ